MISCGLFLFVLSKARASKDRYVVLVTLVFQQVCTDALYMNRFPIIPLAKKEAAEPKYLQGGDGCLRVAWSSV